MPKKEEFHRDYYKGSNAEHYADSSWMARNQLKTAERAYQLLNDEKIGGDLAENPKNQVILDLGCGTGYSRVLFDELGFSTMGIDISFDMLIHNKKYHELLDEEDGVDTLKPILIAAQIEDLPLRPRVCDHIISFSAFNFIFDRAKNTHEKKSIIRRVIEHILSVLKKNGRVIIEFYPKQQDLDLYLNSLRNDFIGGLVIDNPGLRKEQKFLILKKSK